MKFLIRKYGYPRLKWTMIILTTVLTIAFALSIFMAVKTNHDLNSWVSFTMN